MSNTKGGITNAREFSTQTSPDTGDFSAEVPDEPSPFILQGEGTWKIEVWLISDPSVKDTHTGVVSGMEA